MPLVSNISKSVLNICMAILLFLCLGLGGEYSRVFAAYAVRKSLQLRLHHSMAEAMAPHSQASDIGYWQDYMCQGSSTGSGNVLRYKVMDDILCFIHADNLPNVPRLHQGLCCVHVCTLKCLHFNWTAFPSGKLTAGSHTFPLRQQPLWNRVKPENTKYYGYNNGNIVKWLDLI